MSDGPATSKHHHMIFDADGMPEAVIDLSLIREESSELYALMLKNMTEHGEVLAKIVADAAGRAGPGAGIVVLNAMCMLVNGAVAPLVLALAKRGVTQEEVLELIHPASN
ncbi:hypothetical protein [Rhodococcus sp. BP22]|uniref:hypothetical protein n=1 Tax=Rhodococcus sp. BP22 TaxID=2758566 RepID=UPI00164486CA|nr:hypothetical protein [Rhodococcus sp. BP22]